MKKDRTRPQRTSLKLNEEKSGNNALTVVVEGLSGSDVGSSAILSYEFSYRKDEGHERNKEWKVFPEDDEAVESRSLKQEFTVHEPQSKSIYAFRARACNTSGWGMYSHTYRVQAVD